MTDEKETFAGQSVNSPMKLEKEESEKYSSDLIEKAEKAAERLEEGNKRLAELIATQQKMIVENKLSGNTTAGSPEISKEEKETKEAKKFLEGTGLEDYAFPPEKK